MSYARATAEAAGRHGILPERKLQRKGCREFYVQINREALSEDSPLPKMGGKSPGDDEAAGCRAVASAQDERGHPHDEVKLPVSSDILCGPPV